MYFALMVMLGGPRTLFGPLAGALIVTFLPEVMRIDPIDSRIAYGVALIAVVMLLPGGIIAAAERGYRWLAEAVRGARKTRSARREFISGVRRRTVATVLEISGVRKTVRRRRRACGRRPDDPV